MSSNASATEPCCERGMKVLLTKQDVALAIIGMKATGRTYILPEYPNERHYCDHTKRHG